MEHYRFTSDAAFLRETGWPILKESCEFVRSWVIRDRRSGKWVGKASCSHEIGFNYTDENGKEQLSEIGPVTAYDLSIIWQVMNDYLEAAAILGIDDDFTKIPPIAIFRTSWDCIQVPKSPRAKPRNYSRRPKNPS
jgi:alpha-L-fucosidase 2